MSRVLLFAALCYKSQIYRSVSSTCTLVSQRGLLLCSQMRLALNLALFALLRHTLRVQLCCSDLPARLRTILDLPTGIVPLGESLTTDRTGEGDFAHL